MIKIISGIIFRIITVCLIFSLWACEDDPYGDFSSGDQALLEDLEACTHELSPKPLEWTDAQLTFLAPLGDAKMIGLGEATHGTKNFFEAKHRLFQYFVEHFNHKVFAFEADMAECIYLNRYVTKGEGDLESLMKDIMVFWTWKTEEVKALLQWMHDYNLGKAEDEKLQFVGVDCQYLYYQNYLILEYLHQYLPENVNSFTSTWYKIEQFRDNGFDGYTVYDYINLSGRISDFLTLFETDSTDLVTKSGLIEYMTTRQLFNNINQVLQRKMQSVNLSINLRDKNMAINSVFFEKLYESRGRITLWAHNAHVSDEYFLGKESQGRHLKEEYGDDYQIIGFAFSTGSFRAGISNNGVLGKLTTHTVSREPLENSFNYYLHNIELNYFGLSINEILLTASWEQRSFGTDELFGVGSYYNKEWYSILYQSMTESTYDWIIYFDDTEAAVPL